MLTRLLATMTVMALTVPVLADGGSHRNDTDHDSRRHRTQERVGPRARVSPHAQQIVRVPVTSVSRVITRSAYHNDSYHDRHAVRVTHTRRHRSYGYPVYVPVRRHGYFHHAARRQSYRHSHCGSQSGLKIVIRF